MRLLKRSEPTPLQALASFLDALARADRGVLARCLAPNASFIRPGGSVLHGNDSIVAELTRLAVGHALEPEALSLQDMGEIAVCDQRWRRPLACADSAPADATAVLRREGERWLLVLIAFDTDPSVSSTWLPAPCP